MLSIGTVSSAAGASAYYTVGSYYTEGPSQSSWNGDAREAVGLSDGPVSPKEFENILNGKSADGTALTDRAANGQNRAVGIDLTFSAPKSVSILAMGENGEAIKQAIMTANHAMMDFVEKKLVQTRGTDPETGKRTYLGDQKIVYASFMEDTSRANDPGVHVHNPLANLALGPDDKFRAMHNKQIVTHQRLAGAVSRAALAKEMRDMGLNLISTGKHGFFEIANVPPEAISTFSKRREQMEAMRKNATHEKGAMSRIVLLSRPNKVTLNASERHQSWNAQLGELGTSFDQITKDAFDVTPERMPSPDTVLKGVIRDLSETERHFTEFNILRTALMKDAPQVTATELQSAMTAQVKSGELIQSRDGKYFTTPTIVRRESAVITEMNAGHLQGMVIAPSVPTVPNSEGFTLTRGQQNAANHMVSSRDRMIGVQGNAGVGKTTLLESAAPLIKDVGLQLIGIAPSAAAVSALEETGVFDKVMTTQAFCINPVGDDHTFLVVDEASMIGTKSMRNILNYANSKDLARVVLMGDVNQHGAVEAGTPFADMQRAGLRTAKVDEIIRQKSPRHRQGIADLAAGKIRAGIAQLTPDIHKVDLQSMQGYAVQHWAGLNNPKAPIIVQTNIQKAKMNAAVKSLNPQSEPGVKRNILRPVNKTAREKALAATYKGASHMHMNRGVKRMGLKAGETYKILSVDEKRNRVRISRGGKTKTFRPAKYNLSKDTVSLYKTDTLTLHASDRIRFTRGGRSRAFNNNDLGTIKAVSAASMTVELDKGKTVTLPMNAPELSHMDHGWANTGHAFQGKTVADAIVVMPSYDSNLTTLETLYTGASRHKDSVAIITDNVGKLTGNLEQRYQIKADELNLFKPPVDADKAASLDMDSTPSRPGDNRRMTIHSSKEKPSRLEQLFPSPKPQPRDLSRSKPKDIGR